MIFSWILLILFFAAFAGLFGSVSTIFASTMDTTADFLQEDIDRLAAYDAKRQEEGIEAANEKLETDAGVYTVTNGHSIDAWGHPENEDPEGNAQEEFDGINLYYVDAAAFDAGETDETGRPLSEHELYVGFSNKEIVIAAAAVMFQNSGIQENREAYQELLDDLYAVMNPKTTTAACIETDIYSDAYWNPDEEWSETLTLTYYCDDAASRTSAEDTLEEFKEELSLLQEEGAGIYGYRYSVSQTDRDGNSYVEESDVIVLDFTEETNDHGQCITTHDINGITLPIESSDEGCMSYEEVTEIVHESSEGDGYTYGSTGEDTSEYITETLYYCPGHEITLEVTADYGRRDVDIYISTWTLEDLVSFFDMDECIPDWESKSYAEFVWEFVSDGGWQCEEDGYYYQTLLENILERDWEEAYGIDLRTGDVIAGTYSSGEATYSESEIEEILNGEAYAQITGARLLLVEAAYAAVGTISYYYGGKPVSPVYEENEFGKSVSPDAMGRTIWGLDCSGFIDYIAWQVTGENNYMRGMGTAGAPGVEFYDADELQPGDLGMYKSRSDSSQGASNHVGIFVGWDEDGKALWIACGSSGVTLQHNEAFVVYYWCPLE